MPLPSCATQRVTADVKHVRFDAACRKTRIYLYVVSRAIQTVGTLDQDLRRHLCLFEPVRNTLWDLNRSHRRDSRSTLHHQWEPRTDSIDSATTEIFAHSSSPVTTVVAATAIGGGHRKARVRDRRWSAGP